MSRPYRLLAVAVSLIIGLGCSVIGHSAVAKEGGKSPYQLYESAKHGFTLQIPVSWNGYYLIREGKNTIRVAFVGKSEVSGNYSEDGKTLLGLLLFYIGNGKAVSEGADFIDSVHEIGVVGGVRYYSYTGTDFEIGCLDSDDPMIPEEERELRHEDLLKANEMLKDVPQILKSFRAKKH